jgi:DeoD family purine-nucleoside phosphorylase
VPAHDPAAPVHLRPSAEVAERVLAPGDPHRALAVAQALLEKPLMLNHARGLWGYTGTARDGAPLTIQSTGMGGPSAAIVLEELIGLGARRIVRIGTCGALTPHARIGDLLAAQRVLPADGTSAALGADGPLLPDPELTAALVEAGARPATVATTDLFYDPRAGIGRTWAERGALAVEMEAATLLAVAARHGVAAACLLAVTDVPVGADGDAVERVDRDRLEAIGVELGEVGYAALAAGAAG